MWLAPAVLCSEPRAVMEALESFCFDSLIDSWLEWLRICQSIHNWKLSRCKCLPLKKNLTGLVFFLSLFLHGFVVFSLLEWSSPFCTSIIWATLFSNCPCWCFTADLKLLIQFCNTQVLLLKVRCNKSSQPYEVTVYYSFLSIVWNLLPYFIYDIREKAADSLKHLHAHRPKKRIITWLRY